MRWPSAWTDPAALSLLKGSAIDYILIDKGSTLDRVRAAALQQGLHVAPSESVSPAVVTVKGEWPGVRISRGGGNDAGAGPTGLPCVTSNGWRVRLASAFNPQSAIWVDAPPKANDLVTAGSYVTAIADTAAYGGRWIISLDNQLAEGLAARKPASLEAWKRTTAAAAFFASHKDWTQYVPEATVGVLSDFSGPNEFLSHELLNLLARVGQHSRIILKDKTDDSSFRHLRAVIYHDADQPSPALRKRLIAFAESGGLLITGPAWGGMMGTVLDAHPRFGIFEVGRGKIALAKKPADDPYLLANASSVLISHRYDLVRFWNSGAFGSFESRRSCICSSTLIAHRTPRVFEWQGHFAKLLYRP